MVKERELKDACDFCKCEHCVPTFTRDKIASLTSALSDAKRDLEKYGIHRKYPTVCKNYWSAGCDCGFDEALKRIGSVRG